jgi:aldehyde dehydrogenase (NAD(P)+)
MVGNNASFNCNAAKLVVTARTWKQRERFLGLVAKALGQLRPRKAYYPGARDRYTELLRGRAGVRTFGEAQPDALPWALVTDLDAANAAEPLFRVEPFCGILSETQLHADDAPSFLAAVTTFCNERLWGTLNAAIVIHPRTEADPDAATALERAVVELRYGTVSINHWPAVVYGATSPPWGAYPDATLADIQSGSGFVHNTFMLEGVEKSVLRGPLVMSPKPAWFYDNTMVHVIGERLADFEAFPNALKLPGLALAALRG